MPDAPREQLGKGPLTSEVNRSETGCLLAARKRDGLEAVEEA